MNTLLHNRTGLVLGLLWTCLGAGCPAQPADTSLSTVQYYWRDFFSAEPLQIDPDTAAPRPLTFFGSPQVSARPATKLEIGVFSQLTFRAFEEARRSTMEAEANVTLKDQFIVELVWDLFLPQDRFVSEGHITYLLFPEDYYGIGPRTPESAAELYDNRRTELDLNFLSRMGLRNVYAGPRVMVQNMTVTGTETGGLFEQNRVPGGEGYLASGLGYSARWDTRRNRDNPQGGTQLLRFSQVVFNRGLGSDHNFIRYEVEGRQFFSLSPSQPGRDILALQALGIFNSGSPPFRMLALLGDKDDFRGHVRGRFRDRQYYSTQVEYRRELFWRIGATVFGGMGNVAPGLGDFQLETTKAFLGLGGRFKLDRRNNINLRGDIAVNEAGNIAVYFGYGEAF